MSLPSRIVSLVVEQGLGPPPDVPEGDAERTPARLLAGGSVSLAGLLLLVPNGAPLVLGDLSALGVVMSLLGVAISLAMIAVGVLLYRSRFATESTLRIATWNLLGVVVLSAVLAAHAALESLRPGLSGLFLAGNMVAIAAGAHIIIGVVDARRVRAEQLATQRRQTALLNRVLRHNLRQEATLLGGHSERLAEGVEEPSLRASAEAVRESASVVGSLSEMAKRISQAIDAGEAERMEFNLEETVETVVADVCEEHPELSVRVDVGSLSVRANEQLPRALRELLENAAVHADSEAPEATVTAERERGRVRLSVVDNGPGIPSEERDVVLGETEITQLSHGSGLGLWLVKAVVEASDGDLEIASDDGTRVDLVLPAA